MLCFPNVVPRSATAREGPAPEPLVAEAPIYGPRDARDGQAYLRVTMYGVPVTLLLDFTTDGDVTLSEAALSQLGIRPTQTQTLDSLQVAGTSYRDVVISSLIEDPHWHTDGPPVGFPPVVGILGVHFLTTQFDLLYDFPHRRVRLYAVSKTSSDWLPPEIKASDCGPLVDVSPGPTAFTGMTVRLDGHPMTGALEMIPYGSETVRDEKMNLVAFHALALPEKSPRIQPNPHPLVAPNGQPATDEVTGVRVTLGSHTVYAGAIKIFPALEVENYLPHETPVMLFNLVTIRQMILLNSVSSQRVCLSAP